VLLSGSAAQWATVVPNRLSLKSGERQDLALSWNVPCGVQGRQELGTTVQTDAGAVQQSEISFEVGSCENIRLTPKTNSFQGCPCKTAVFEYLVENIGSFTEQFSVGADEFAEFAKVSESQFSLMPGASRSVFLYVSPTCDIHGSFQGTFSVEGANNQIVAQTPYFLNILPCYDYNVFLGKLTKENTTASTAFKAANESYRICQSESWNLPLLFKNVAEIPNSYQLSLDGPAWARLSMSEVSLASNQSRIVHISIGSEQQPGNYVFSVKVLTVVGNLESQFQIPISVENCNAPKFDLNRLAVNYSEQSNALSVTNTGTKETTYVMNIYGLNWADIKPTSITLAAGGTGKLTIHTLPPVTAAEGDYTATVVAKASDTGVQYQSQLTISLRERKQAFPAFLERVLGFFSLYKWYLLAGLVLVVLMLALLAAAMKKKEPEAVAEEERLVAKVAKMKAKPKEEKRVEPKPARAEVREREGKPIWVTIAFILFVLAALAGMAYFGYQWYKQRTPAEVVAPPTAPPEQRPPMFNITPPENITKPENVAVTNITEVPVKPARAYLTRARQLFCIYYKYLVIGVAVLLALVLLVVIARRVKNLKRFFGWLILLLLIFAVVAGYFICFKPSLKELIQKNVTVAPKPTYQRDAVLSAVENGIYGYDAQGNVVNTVTGQRVSSAEFLAILQRNRENILQKTNLSELQLNQTIAVFEKLVYGAPKPAVNCSIKVQKNTPLFINLSRAFYDPDLDVLSYDSTLPKNVMVTIEGEMAELVPDRDFVGIDYVEFTAEDKDGATAKSGNLTICVEEPSRAASFRTQYERVRQFFITYLAYIIAGIVILIILIAILRYRRPIMESIEEPPKPATHRKRGRR
jgi:hypothetical protein